MTPEEIVNNTKASQDPTELLKIYQHIAVINSKVIVEVGSWRGYSLELLDMLYRPDVLVGIESDESVFLPEYKKYKVIFGNSNDENTVKELQRCLGGRPIDFLFIDGDHRYESVKKDFELYSRFVRTGGIIGFHDVALEGKNADGHEWWSLGLQVKKFWDEIKIKYHHVEYRGSTLATGTGLLFV